MDEGEWEAIKFRNEATSCMSEAGHASKLLP